MINQTYLRIYIFMVGL